MKKIITLVLVSLTLLLGVNDKSLASASSFNVKLNGKNTTVYDVNLILDSKRVQAEYKPYIYNDRTFVPVRLVAEFFNSKVDWKQDSKSVVITKGKDIIIIAVDKKEALKNGEPISLGDDSISKLVTYPNGEGKTMVPLRVISELLGYEVGWDQGSRSVTIASKTPLVKGPQITAISKINGTSKNEQIKIVGSGKINYKSTFEEDKNAVLVDITGSTFNIGGKTSGQIDIKGKLVEAVEYSSDLNANTGKLRIQLNRYVDHNIKSLAGGNELNISFTNQVTGIRPITYSNQPAILIENVKSSEYNVIKLQNPFRYVIDIKDASFISDKDAAKFDIQMGFVSGVRANQFIPDSNYSKNDNIVRVVLDSKEGVTSGEVKIVVDGDDMIVIPKDSSADNVTKPITDISQIPDNPIGSGNQVDEEGAFDNVEEIEVVERKPRIKPNSKKEVVIVVDAGHGGAQPGAISEDGVKEKDLNYDVAIRTQQLLESYGYTIIMTRSSDSTLSTYDRPKIANESNAHVFLSIHANSSPNTDANGIETLYAPRDTTSVKYDPQYPLAQKIHYELINETNMTNRGIKQRPDLIVLKHTEMPAVLVELGFMSNLTDIEVIQTEEFKNACATALARGIKNYIYETYGY